MNPSPRVGHPGPLGRYDARPVNHYEALGVPVGAGVAEIRQAYLSAARRHHPDFHVDADAPTRARHARQMQVVNEAWGVLGDPTARQRYDLGLQGPVGPPTERIRPNRDPQVPAGKGWTPRRGDDGWQRDYRGWVDEDEPLAPDRPTRSGRPRNRGIVAIAPVALFGAAVLSIFLGLVLSARPLVAIGFAAGALSASLFVVLPVLEMSRGRHRD